jgi:hypothetical protein
MGWRFWRCWGSSWTLERQACIDNLVETLGERGIIPIGTEGVGRHMSIGIYTFRTDKWCSWLPGMLAIPFVDTVQRYAINRRQWEPTHEQQPGSDYPNPAFPNSISPKSDRLLASPCQRVTLQLENWEVWPRGWISYPRNRAS